MKFSNKKIQEEKSFSKKKLFLLFTKLEIKDSNVLILKEILDIISRNYHNFTKSWMLIDLKLFSIGGLEILAMKGKIKVDNTLEARLGNKNF